MRRNITFPGKINQWSWQEDEGEQGRVGTSMTSVAVFKRIALFHCSLRPSEMELSMLGDYVQWRHLKQATSQDLARDWPQPRLD